MKIAYPPCKTNIWTERPYTRHKWIIPKDAAIRVKMVKGEEIHFYRVRCARCGINDPNAPLH